MSQRRSPSHRPSSPSFPGLGLILGAPLCLQPQFPQTRTVCMCFTSLAETTERNGSLRIRSAMRLGGGTPCSPHVSQARTGPPVATSPQGLHTNGPRTHVHSKHSLQSSQIMCCTHAHSDAHIWCTQDKQGNTYTNKNKYTSLKICYKEKTLLQERQDVSCAGIQVKQLCI